MEKDFTLVHPLFSSPIYHVPDTGFRLSEDVLKQLEEIDYSDLGKQTADNAVKNSSSVYALSNPLLKEAYNVCKKHLDLFIKDVCSYKEEFIITNSWISKKRTGIGHHSHRHSNTIFSGCLYLQADGDSAPIIFTGEPQLSKSFPFSYKIKQQNIYNSQAWPIQVSTGSIIIFPSDLMHEVHPNQSEKTRITLGFNSFVKANFGNEYYASDLNLTGIGNTGNEFISDGVHY
jgi:uncharacterized protein (TIGR02466 family)